MNRDKMLEESKKEVAAIEQASQYTRDIEAIKSLFKNSIGLLAEEVYRLQRVEEALYRVVGSCDDNICGNKLCWEHCDEPCSVSDIRKMLSKYEIREK